MAFTAPATDWENKTSQDLYLSALKKIKEGQTSIAIRELSEILEFFPRTKHWPLACIKLSDLYLQQKNSKISEDLLKRLTHSASFNNELNEESLLAQWDFFSKQGRYKKLNEWLNNRSDAEKTLLKKSQPMSERLISMIKNAPLTQMVSTYRYLGFEDPLSNIIDRVEKEKFILKKTQLQLILNESILLENVTLIARCARLMAKAGWHKEANEVFNKHASEKPPLFLQSWVNLLMNGKLWSSALNVIDQYQNQDFQKEKVLAFCGMEKWQEAYNIIIDSKKWIFHSLSVEDISEVINGLEDQKVTTELKKNLISQIPDGEKKNIIIALLENTPDKRENLFKSVIENSSLYSDLAYAELGKIYFKLRQLKNLQGIARELGENHPNSKYRKEVDSWVRTLTSIKPD